MNTQEVKSATTAIVQKLLHCKYRGALEWLIAPAVVIGGLAYLAWKYPVTSTLLVLFTAVGGIEVSRG